MLGMCNIHSLFFHSIADATFRFLPRLKERSLQKPGNPEFWAEVKALGRDISLISNKEARKYGGAASVSEKRAEEVSRKIIEFCVLGLIAPFSLWLDCLQVPVSKIPCNFTSFVPILQG